MCLSAAPGVFVSRPTIKQASSDEDYGSKSHPKTAKPKRQYVDPDVRASFSGRVNYNEKDVSYGIESEEEEMGSWQASGVEAGESLRTDTTKRRRGD